MYGAPSSPKRLSTHSSMYPRTGSGFTYGRRVGGSRQSSTLYIEITPMGTACTIHDDQLDLSCGNATPDHYE